MAQTHMEGHLYRKGKSWHVRWREWERLADGTERKRNRSQRLASIADYPRKKEVLPLKSEFMARLNATGFTSEAAVTLGDFVDSVYLPYVTEQKRPSTLRGYRQIWNAYVRDNVRNIRVRDFQPRDGEVLMQAIARRHDLSRRTLQHIKAFVSGVFTYARRMGTFAGANPMEPVSIPLGRPARKTHAYTLGNVQAMLPILPEPARTIVAVAAFTGLRAGEIRGLRWEAYRNGELEVSWSVWKRHTTAPKSSTSENTVPAIPALQDMLDTYRASLGSPTSGLIFPSERLNPIDLDNLAKRVIRPAVESVGISWHGYHAFRRGLATVLHDMGVDDLTIQRILRHSNVQVTQQAYIQTMPHQVTNAMARLEQAVVAKSTLGSPAVRPVN